MKRIIIVISAFGLLIACNSGGDEEANGNDTTSTENTAVNDRTQSPYYEKGLQLEANSDCKTCHAIDFRIQGPSYEEIATKYASLPDTVLVSRLANTIRTGVPIGQGVWNTSFAMTPHPALTQEDAEALVRYVFLFEKK